MSVAVMLMLSCFIFLGRNYLGEMFAPHEQEVIEKVASVLKIVCAFMVTRQNWTLVNIFFL